VPSALPVGGDHAQHSGALAGDVAPYVTVLSPAERGCPHCRESQIRGKTRIRTGETTVFRGRGRRYVDRTTSSPTPRTSSLDTFVAAAPWPQRLVLRALLAIARRPRGAALLAYGAPLDQVVRGLLTVEHYDDPRVGRTLGWDADGVVARGRELRRAEGRP